MSDIRLENNDIHIQDGDLVLTRFESLEAVIQHLKQRLNTFYQEWFLDQRIGLPYFQHIMVKNPDPIVIDSLFKREILSTPAILELLDFSLDVSSDRQLTLKFKARASEGIINFDEVIPSI